jgi:hypothetical protein
VGAAGEVHRPVGELAHSGGGGRTGGGFWLGQGPGIDGLGVVVHFLYGPFCLAGVGVKGI